MPAHRDDERSDQEVLAGTQSPFRHRGEETIPTEPGQVAFLLESSFAFGSDDKERLGALYPKTFVAAVAKELAGTLQAAEQGMVTDVEAYVQRIHERFTCRMYDLSKFMKTLLQRFTRWHSSRAKRCGNLWEETFKSVVVEGGLASKTIAAYIDLNPVRAGMEQDPAEYRWSSYGEGMGVSGRSGAKAKAAGASGTAELLWSAWDLR